MADVAPMQLLTHIDVRVNQCADADMVHVIESNLLRDLQAASGVRDYVPLAVAARSHDGRLLGGLIGSTSYGWLLIKMLWVEEGVRSRGLGTLLMRRAEQEAVHRQCHAAWLDTSSARARQFYEKLGYRLFGRLANVAEEKPAGHFRHFLCKRLCGAPDEAVHAREELQP